MSDIEKVSIALTMELDEKVRAAVRSGDYASSSEVIRDALRDWSERRDERAATLAHYRQLIDEGLASGKPRPARRFDEIKAAALKRLTKA